MCTTCGCSSNAKATVTDLETGKTVELAHDHHPHVHAHHNHDHPHGHGHHHHDDHSHDHSHAQRHGTTLTLEADLLAKNNRLAERNRGWFEGRNILSLNLVSSPGSGKTTLLERTITDLKGVFPINVIEGDQETAHDAQRIRATGCKVVQINTGSGCHLEADMLARGLKDLNPPLNSIVMIENVGNLVCPALFDLGEKCKVVILSVTEGEDKPIKYPHMFRAAEVMLLNKIDLLPHLNFKVNDCINYAKMVNPAIEIFQLSAVSGEGLDRWYDWLKQQVSANAIQQELA
jgi:hydrogenase nickel incorporation protein HypB